MKANELMIGDWVLCSSLPEAGFCKVCGMDAPTKSRKEYIIELTDQYGRRLWVYEHFIKPIPLTAEILEKNGFIKDAYKDNRLTDAYHLLVPTGFERKSFTIQVSLYKKPICGVSTLVKCWGWLPPYNGGMNDIHLCSANYVHQLQHAIRLCGIEKEIKL